MKTSLDPSKQSEIAMAIRDFGVAQTRGMYGISQAEINQIIFDHQAELLIERDCLQKRIFDLKEQGKNSKQVANILGQPLTLVNDLWNPFTKHQVHHYQRLNN